MYLLTIVKRPVKWLLFLVYFLTLMWVLTLKWNTGGRNSEQGTSQAASPEGTGSAWMGERDIELTLNNPAQASKEQEEQARSTNDLHPLYQENKSFCLYFTV